MSHGNLKKLKYFFSNSIFYSFVAVFSIFSSNIPVLINFSSFTSSYPVLHHFFQFCINFSILCINFSSFCINFSSCTSISPVLHQLFQLFPVLFFLFCINFSSFCINFSTQFFQLPPKCSNNCPDSTSARTYGRMV